MPGTARSGRRPLPSNVKQLRGRRPGVDAGGRAIAPGAKPPPAAPPEPQWGHVLLGDSKEIVAARKDARAEWRRVVPVLDNLGLLTKVDAVVLTDYCVCWARLVQCERALATEGLVVTIYGETLDGGLVPVAKRRNPYSMTVKEYRGQLRWYVAELGLGPSSRGRLAIGGTASDEDDLYDA